MRQKTKQQTVSRTGSGAPRRKRVARTGFRTDAGVLSRRSCRHDGAEQSHHLYEPSAVAAVGLATRRDSESRYIYIVLRSHLCHLCIYIRSHLMPARGPLNITFAWIRLEAATVWKYGEACFVMTPTSCITL